MEQDPHSNIKFPQEIRQITTTNEIATVETYYENGNVSERAHVKNGIAEGQSQSFSREGVLLCGANWSIILKTLDMKHHKLDQIYQNL